MWRSIFRSGLGFCAILALVSSVNVLAAHHSEREIHCSKSTLQVDFDRLLGQSECLRRDYEMHGATFRELSTEWHRFDRIEDGFLNLRYMEAGPRKRFEYLDLKDELKSRFRRISSSAKDWEALMTFGSGSREFEVRAFQLPNDRRCLGFVTRWFRIHSGWKYKIVGYYCRIARDPNLSDLSQLLAEVRIIEAPKGVTGAVLRRSKITETRTLSMLITSDVRRTDNGQELADELEEIVLEGRSFLVYVKWSHLTLEPHTAKVRIYDGADREVLNSPRTFTPRQPRWNLWWRYSLYPKEDKPGRWRIEVDLDDETLAETSLIVSAP